MFVAVVLWPLALIPVLGDGPTAPLSIWQLYFVTTAHRWITLLIVGFDPDRRGGRDSLFVAIAIAAAVLVVGIYFCTGGLACLIVLDLVWNIWHFGSQHAGILRIYARKVGGGWPWLERYGVRAFVVYAGVRVTAAFATHLGQSPGVTDSSIRQLIVAFDHLILLIPIGIVVTNLIDGVSGRWGKLAYASSVSVLYSGLILSLNYAPQLVVPFALASALMHATEYLAVVTHYAWQRRTVGSAGRFRAMSANWLLILVWSMLGLGAFSALSGSVWVELWLAANLFAALLHYAYDGLIWKLRKPDTATALGIGTHS